MSASIISRRRASLAILLLLSQVGVLGFVTIDYTRFAILQTQEYVMAQRTLSQYGLLNSTEDNKDAVLAAVNQMVGQPTSVRQGTMRGTTADDVAHANTMHQMHARLVDPSSPVAQYVAWTEQRHAANAILAERVNAEMRASAGRPLDWAEHAKLSARLGAQSNEALTAYIAQSNAGVETRASQEGEKNRLLQKTNAREERERVEALLRKRESLLE